MAGSRLTARKILTPLAYKGDDNALALQTEETTDWLGYCPDIRPESLGWRATTTTRLIAKGETLVPDWGFIRSHAFKFGEDTGGGDHAGEGTVGNADVPQAIIWMGSWGRAASPDLLIVTADNSSTTYSHIFRRTGSAGSYTWTEVQPTGDFSGGYGLRDFAPSVGAIALAPSQVIDGVTFAGGSPTTSDVAGAQVATAMGQQQSVYIMVFGDANEVLFIRSGAADNYDYYVDNTPYTNSPDQFKAASVASFDGRGCYWNTTESTVPHPLRFRHSVVGDPANLVGVGSGFIDATELSGRGTVIRQVGNVLYAFATGGICRFVATPFSGDDLSIYAPFNLEYVSTTRGVWAPGCTAPWGEDLIFVIATDGWFFMNEQGQFDEAGLTQVGSVKTHKWMKTFYQLLNKSAVTAIKCVPDYFDNVIRIYFPTGSDTVPNVCWIYDVQTDRVWIDTDYVASSGFPLCGVTVPSTVSSATLGSLGGTLGGHPFSLGYYGSSLDMETTYIATATGNLYEFSKTDYGRQDLSAVSHGPLVTLESNMTNHGASLLNKLYSRIGITYSVEAAGPLTLTIYTNDGTYTDGVDLVATHFPQVATVFPNITGRLVSMFIYFEGVLRVRSLLCEYYVAAGDADGLT